VIGLLLVGGYLYKRHDQTSGPVAAAEGKLGSGTARSPAIASDSPAAHVVVAVTDRAGPVANASVRCAPVDGEVVVVKTASDGSASIDLAAGQWSIAASADGHEPAATTVAIVANHDERVRLVLAAGGQTLTGVVTDMTGGVIAGARIDAARLRSNAKAGDAIAVAFSDDAGRYKLAIGAGEIFVAASHPEYASQSRYVDLGAGGATADFALVPGGVIEGVVRDVETKQPVAGAAVWANSHSPAIEIEADARIVKSDAAGKFRFSGLRPGGYELTARAGARRSRMPVEVGLGVAEEQTDIVVMVGGTGAIRGKVVDEGGAPAAKVTIIGGPERDTAISDDAGAFVLEGLPPGRWSLSGASDRYIADGQVMVELKKTDVAGVVVHVRRGLEVKGHVEPREICDVEIANTEGNEPMARRYATTTNADGAFHFEPFGAGNAALIARCPNGDQGTSTVVVAPGGGETIVPVAPGGSIEGRIVDAAGKPVAGVMVSAETATEMRRLDMGNVVSGVKAVTSATGGFAIGSLSAGNYRLAVLETGRLMKPTKAVTLALAAGQHATGVEVVVERPAGTIEGTVTDQNGAPIAGAWVAVHQSFRDAMESACEDASNCRVMGSVSTGAHQPPPAMTDARGHFALTSLPRGRYQVVAEAQAGKLRGRAADVTTDAQISIQLTTVGALRGTVRGPRGPADLFSVDVQGPSGDERSFTDGAFVFPKLDPGDYSIDVTASEGTGKATARVSPGEEASIDITLVANGTVTGRVVDKAGKPLSGMGVALIPDQPPGQLSIMLREPPPNSGPDGRFQVVGPPGMRTLVIMGRKPTAKRGVSVASDRTIDVGDVTIDPASADDDQSAAKQ
jgi:protocatechuate 3,4-dioxygenase beta subunit